MRISKGVTVLLSGGIDSTACVHFFQEAGVRTNALFVDYGQAAREQEAHYSRQIADYYRVPLKIASVDVGRGFAAGEVLGRNQLLISVAILGGTTTPLIAMGIHRGTKYYDCSAHFAKTQQRLLRNMDRGHTELLFPFLELTKSEIIAYSVEHDIPLHITYSCESGGKKPCGSCYSCRDRNHVDSCLSA